MENYERVKKLGQGSFGAVHLVRDKRDNQLYVMKDVDLTTLGTKERREALQEVKFLAKFSHPALVGYREWFERLVPGFSGSTKRSLHMVMEYADNGDLAGLIKSQRRGKLIPEETVAHFLVQIVLALKHMHDRKVIHRDIKAENVFLTKENFVKIGDFGISRMLDNTLANARTRIGTPYYLSPEICLDKPYDARTDMWALGVVLYQLCAQRHPFDATSMEGLLHAIIHTRPRPLSTVYSKGLRDLIEKLLQKQPKTRPTVYATIKYPYVDTCIKRFLTNPAVPSDHLAAMIASYKFAPQTGVSPDSPQIMSSGGAQETKGDSGTKLGGGSGSDMKLSGGNSSGGKGPRQDDGGGGGDAAPGVRFNPQADMIHDHGAGADPRRPTNQPPRQQYDGFGYGTPIAPSDAQQPIAPRSPPQRRSARDENAGAGYPPRAPRPPLHPNVPVNSNANYQYYSNQDQASAYSSGEASTPQADPNQMQQARLGGAPGSSPAGPSGQNYQGARASRYRTPASSAPPGPPIRDLAPPSLPPLSKLNPALQNAPMMNKQDEDGVTGGVGDSHMHINSTSHERRYYRQQAQGAETGSAAPRNDGAINPGFGGPRGGQASREGAHSSLNTSHDDLRSSGERLGLAYGSDANTASSANRAVGGVNQRELASQREAEALALIRAQIRAEKEELRLKRMQQQQSSIFGPGSPPAPSSNQGHTGYPSNSPPKPVPPFPPHLPPISPTPRTPVRRQQVPGSNGIVYPRESPRLDPFERNPYQELLSYRGVQPANGAQPPAQPGAGEDYRRNGDDYGYMRSPPPGRPPVSRTPAAPRLPPVIASGMQSARRADPRSRWK